jgi:hypothetical protein
MAAEKIEKKQNNREILVIKFPKSVFVVFIFQFSILAMPAIGEKKKRERKKEFLRFCKQSNKEEEERHRRTSGSNWLDKEC